MQGSYLNSQLRYWIISQKNLNTQAAMKMRRTKNLCFSQILSLATKILSTMENHHLRLLYHKELSKMFQINNRKKMSRRIII